MKRIFILTLCIIMIFLCGCKRVIMRPQDELTLSSWQYSGKNGMSAKLEFHDEKARLDICSSSYDEAHTVEGTYSVDSENLYITDTSKYKTYTFSYEAYANRVYLSYMGNRVKFERINPAAQNSG